MPRELNIEELAKMSPSQLTNHFREERARRQSESQQGYHMSSDSENLLWQNEDKTEFIDYSFQDLQMKSDINKINEELADQKLVETKRKMIEDLERLKGDKENNRERLYNLCIETLDHVFDEDWEKKNLPDYDPDTAIDVDL